MKNVLRFLPNDKSFCQCVSHQAIPSALLYRAAPLALLSCYFSIWRLCYCTKWLPAKIGTQFIQRLYLLLTCTRTLEPQRDEYQRYPILVRTGCQDIFNHSMQLTFYSSSSSKHWLPSMNQKQLRPLNLF